MMLGWLCVPALKDKMFRAVYAEYVVKNDICVFIYL